LETRAWLKKKRADSLAKQKKAEAARQLCDRKQAKREQNIKDNIDRKLSVAQQMKVEKKAELDMKLEEAHILNASKREKLQRLVARRDYNEQKYLEVANKRVEKIDEAHRFKDILMKERRQILYTMAQAELEAREDLKLIKLRLPTSKDIAENKRQMQKNKKRATSSMF